MIIKKMWTLLVAFVAASAAFTQPPRKVVPQTIRPLPARVVAQHDRIQRLLPPATKERIEKLVPAFRSEVTKLPPRTDFEKLAEDDVRKAFPRLSQQQADVLSFALLKQTADSMSEMSESDQLLLQQAMEKHSKLEQICSNMIKRVEDTKDAIISNAKL